MKNVVNKQHGFTLLELVVVVAVMGLIASLATEFVVQDSNQKRYELTKSKRTIARAAIASYYNDCNEFPDKLSRLLEVNKVAAGCDDGDDDWKGPYILDVDYEGAKTVYRDGWGNVNSNASEDAGNYGWFYHRHSASVALGTYGLDGAASVASPGTAVEVYERDYWLDYPLITSGALSDTYRLQYTVSSSAVATLQCLNSVGASVAIASCQAN